MNYFSEEWIELRKRIESDIEKQTAALRRADDLKGLFTAQGAIQALEALLKLADKANK